MCLANAKSTPKAAKPFSRGKRVGRRVPAPGGGSPAGADFRLTSRHRPGAPESGRRVLSGTDGGRIEAHWGFAGR